MSDYICADSGHVWLEPDDTPYARHRGSTPEHVGVHCRYCPATASLPRYSGFSGKRAPGQPIDTTIPPQLKVVIDRALESANTGPVPKP